MGFHYPQSVEGVKRRIGCVAVVGPGGLDVCDAIVRDSDTQPASRLLFRGRDAA
jgi:hypothetical protein